MLARHLFFLSASKSPFVGNGKLPSSFADKLLYGYALMGVFAKWRPASLYEIKSATTPFLELFVQRSLLSEDGSCLQHCDCSWLLLLTSSTDRSSLRSRFSFGLSWSICSCDTLHAEKYIACWLTIVYNGTRHGNVLCIGDGYCK